MKPLAERLKDADATGVLALLRSEWDALSSVRPPAPAEAFNVGRLGVVLGIRVVLLEDGEHSKPLCHGQVWGCSCQGPTAAEVEEARAGLRRIRDLLEPLEAGALDHVDDEHAGESEAGVLHGALDHAGPRGEAVEEPWGRLGGVVLGPLLPRPTDVIIGNGA